MNAAQRLFLEQGVSQTTIEQITSGAEVAKGTFYLHFSSKEDVLGALRERFIRQFAEDVREAVARRPKNDWRGKLGAWVRAGVAGLLDAEAIAGVLFHAQPQLPPDWNNVNIVIDPLRSLLENGNAQGAWNVDDPHFIAVLLHTGLQGVVDDTLLGKRRLSRAQLVRKVERVCFSVVGLPQA